jgi:hypothetical protein
LQPNGKVGEGTKLHGDEPSGVRRFINSEEIVKTTPRKVAFLWAELTDDAAAPGFAVASNPF